MLRRKRTRFGLVLSSLSVALSPLLAWAQDESQASSQVAKGNQAEEARPSGGEVTEKQEPDDEDKMTPPGYVPGQRTVMGAGLSPHAPGRETILPGAIAPAFAAPVLPLLVRQFNDWSPGAKRSSVTG